MTEIIRFNTIAEFIQYNRSFVDRKPLQNIFLRRMMSVAYREEDMPEKFFNIIGDENVFVVTMLFDELLLIYADSVDDESVSKLSEELEFSNSFNGSIAGTKDVISKLLSLHSITDFDIEKSRNIYECRKAADDFQYSLGELQMCDDSDLDTLAEYSMAFAKEYDGTVIAPIHAAANVMSSINNSAMYQWVSNNKICAVSQTMMEAGCSYPIIGHVYTAPESRSQGYAASMVHKVTCGLLNEGHEACTLTTNADNPASNGAFIKAGYKKIGDYFLIQKTDDAVKF